MKLLRTFECREFIRSLIKIKINININCRSCASALFQKFSEFPYFCRCSYYIFSLSHPLLLSPAIDWIRKQSLRRKKNQQRQQHGRNTIGTCWEITANQTHITHNGAHKKFIQSVAFTFPNPKTKTTFAFNAKRNQSI